MSGLLSSQLQLALEFLRLQAHHRPIEHVCDGSITEGVERLAADLNPVTWVQENRRAVKFAGHHATLVHEWVFTALGAGQFSVFAVSVFNLDFIAGNRRRCALWESPAHTQFGLFDYGDHIFEFIGDRSKLHIERL